MFCDGRCRVDPFMLKCVFGICICICFCICIFHVLLKNFLWWKMSCWFMSCWFMSCWFMSYWNMSCNNNGRCSVDHFMLKMGKLMEYVMFINLKLKYSAYICSVYQFPMWCWLRTVGHISNELCFAMLPYNSETNITSSLWHHTIGSESSICKTRHVNRSQRRNS